jgi:hypothetical protein
MGARGKTEVHALADPALSIDLVRGVPLNGSLLATLPLALEVFAPAGRILESIAAAGLDDAQKLLDVAWLQLADEDPDEQICARRSDGVEIVVLDDAKAASLS